MSQTRTSEAFATPEDYEVCRRLHREFGTTYYFAANRFPEPQRRYTHALYGFVREADEWVDNPGLMTPDEVRLKLETYRSELLRGVEGVRPEMPVLRAFCDVMRECRIGVEEPLQFLDAMAMDLCRTRYETWDDLLGYTRGSAVAVGLMMCAVLGATNGGELGQRSLAEERVAEGATALGNAMQLTNFLRDVGEDARRGRIYLPLADLENFGVTESKLMAGRVDEAFTQLMKFEIARARALYAASDGAIPLLPPEGRKAVRLARILYSRILDRIEERGYDVFTGRARTSKLEKLAAAAQVLFTCQVFSF